MKIIRLTEDGRGHDVFVNVDAISHFLSFEYSTDTRHTYTKLYLVNDPCMLKIREKPEEIIELIKLTKEI